MFLCLWLRVVVLRKRLASNPSLVEFSFRAAIRSFLSYENSAINFDEVSMVLIYLCMFVATCCSIFETSDCSDYFAVFW